MKLKQKIILIIFSILLGSITAYSEEVSYVAGNYYNQGIANFQNKSYSAAVICFQKAIQSDPTYVDAYYNLATVYNYLNQKENAISTYAKLLKIKPDDHDANYEIAKNYMDIESYTLALKYLSSIPQSYESYAKVETLRSQINTKIKIREERQKRNKITTADPSKKTMFYKLSSPTGITSDSKGNIYIANYTNNYISKITPNKSHIAFAKSPFINSPVGIAADKFDNLYVANYEANNILKITPAGQVYVFMTNVNKPYYLYIKNDVLYISEQDTNTVIRYNLNN